MGNGFNTPEGEGVQVLKHHKDRVREAVEILGEGATPEDVAKYWVEKIDSLPDKRQARKYGFDRGNKDSFRQGLIVEARAVLDGSAIIISDDEISEGGYVCQNSCPTKAYECRWKREQMIKVELLELGFKRVEQ